MSLLPRIRFVVLPRVTADIKRIYNSNSYSLAKTFCTTHVKFYFFDVIENRGGFSLARLVCTTSQIKNTNRKMTENELMRELKQSKPSNNR
jgi:hypothetical protein